MSIAIPSLQELRETPLPVVAARGARVVTARAGQALTAVRPTLVVLARGLARLGLTATLMAALVGLFMALIGPTLRSLH